MTKKEFNCELDMKNIGINLYAKDEIFCKVRGWKNYWISNYSRLLEYDEKYGYKILKPYQDRDSKYHQYYYRKLKDKNRIDKQLPLKNLYHRLVAKAFCDNSNPDEKIEVHHIITFDPKLDYEINNRADNLIWVNTTVHNFLDSIECVNLTNTHGITTEYKNPFDAFRELCMNEEFFYYELICKFEPVIDNLDMKYVKYDIILGQSKKRYLVTIYSKDVKGVRENYVVGKIEENMKREIEKYGEMRKHA